MQPDPRALAIARHVNNRGHAARMDQHRQEEREILWLLFAAVSSLLVAVSIVALAFG
ncbi:hypothetical protein [Rhodovarius crocodyli]|uniref:hypothetical protein n=1 Tax=Rhodovarius crocodyli TaxID=1979269 RepID=UPI0013E2A40E|nr:hypothetical protein [Rhodovarius crocodyli]